jgi:hypothetical protein
MSRRSLGFVWVGDRRGGSRNTLPIADRACHFLAPLLSTPFLLMRERPEATPRSKGICRVGLYLDPDAAGMWAQAKSAGYIWGRCPRHAAFGLRRSFGMRVERAMSNGRQPGT